jgi:agmatinase
MRFTPALLSFAATVAAHGDHDHDQEPLAGPHEGLWYNTLPGDGGTQVWSSKPQLNLRGRN